MLGNVGDEKSLIFMGLAQDAFDFNIARIMIVIRLCSVP